MMERLLYMVLLLLAINVNSQVITFVKSEISKGGLMESDFNKLVDSSAIYVKCDTIGGNFADYYIDERKLIWDKQDFIDIIEGGSMIDMVQMIMRIDTVDVDKTLDNKFRNIAKLEIINGKQYYVTVAKDQCVGMTGSQIYDLLVEYPKMELIGVTEFKKIRDAVKK